MLEIALFVLFVTFSSALIQDKFKIPASVTIITVGLIMNALGYGGIIKNDKMFDQILLLLLPSLLLMDILHLKLKDLKTHAFSLIYVAGISAILTIVAGVLMSSYIFPDHNISIPAMIMLMCMVSATDPVAVSAVFHNYKVPKHLKVLAEGESLFNDATYLVAFSISSMILAYTLSGSGVELTSIDISIKAITIIGLSFLIGVAYGLVGLFLLNLTSNEKIETSIILFIACASFYSAEVFHFSGIVSVITSILIANHVITERISKYQNAQKQALDNDEKEKLFVSKINQERIFGNVQFIAMIGITILFLSMGDIVNFSNIIKYWKEVLYVFFASTIIRIVMMMKFSVLSNATNKMHNISLHWYKILVFAGVKGGLSILMLHLMPSGFEHKEMFEAIVIGVILLSTFIYPIMMTITMKMHNEKFDLDCKADT